MGSSEAVKNPEAWPHDSQSSGTGLGRFFASEDCPMSDVPQKNDGEQVLDVAPVANPVAEPIGKTDASSMYDRVTNILEFVSTMGQKFAKSGMGGCTKVEQGEIIMMECMARRMSPLEFVKDYHLVNGKVTMRADAMAAKFNQAGGHIAWEEFSDKLAKATFTDRRGHKTTISYGIEEAAKAGVANRAGAWKQHTAAMLRARLISKAIRMVAPECITGCYTEDEISGGDVQVDRPLFTKQQ